MRGPPTISGLTPLLDLSGEAQTEIGAAFLATRHSSLVTRHYPIVTTHPRSDRPLRCLQIVVADWNVTP